MDYADVDDERQYEYLNPPGLTGWAYFVAHVDLYYDMGEYGVIYTDKRSPYHVIKVANLDITDGESNYEMADFLRDNWYREIEGLVKITSVFVGNCDGPGKLRKAVNVLDLEEDDEILMFRMELLPFLGLTHPDLDKEEMIDRVASAAYNVGNETGIVLTDLKPANYGFREDGSAVIFDFNIEEGFRSKEEYKKRITDAS